MPTIFEVFFLLQLSSIGFFYFRIAEAHLDVIFPQKWHFR